jgi:DNA-binding transcriptional regulator YbjK
VERIPVARPLSQVAPLSDLEDETLTASELASEFVHALIARAGEVDVDAGDAAALAALDLVVRLAVYGRAPLQVVLDTIAAAAPVREALVRDANRRNQQPPPLSAARLDPLVDSCRLN